MLGRKYEEDKFFELYFRDEICNGTLPEGVLMEASLTKSGVSYKVSMTLTEDDADAYLQADTQSDSSEGTHAVVPSVFDSKHFCVTVVDMGGRPVYQETIKTHPIWAPARAFKIMREHMGTGYQMHGGQC